MGRVNREKFKVLEGVFDEFTLDVLENLKRRKYFDTLLNPIKTGKEGDVYLANKLIEDNSSFNLNLSSQLDSESNNKEFEYRAIKIFRVTSANFKKISSYINRDFRFRNIKGNLRKVIFVWTEKEFRNLIICHKANMNVPMPYRQQMNVVVMEYIDGGMLKDITLEKPEEFFELLLEQMYIMKNTAKLIHGDLSEYNIMVRNQMPVIIDLGQAMGIKSDEDFKIFYDLFERDVENVVKYFKKRYNLKTSKEEVIKYLTS